MVEEASWDETGLGLPLLDEESNPCQMLTLDTLSAVEGISESARKLFIGMLAACVYCWLTVATTTDVNLITNRASSQLPIIQTSIPIVGFYVAAPLLLLCVYFYFHFYLQKLWEELGSLPAIFPDGRPLHAKVDPWLLNDLVRAHLPKLNVNRPFLSYFQLWISVLLAWWVAPFTMLLFWGRYLRRHERIGTAFHVVLLVISIIAAVCLYRLAVATLRGSERKPFAWEKALTIHRDYEGATLAIAAGALFGLFSLGAIQGVRSSTPILGFKPRSEEPFGENWGPRTWVPRAMALIGYPPFANLTGVEVSQKKSSWTAKQETGRDSDSVIGAELIGADLRYASAEGAFLADADLTGADLTGADLRHSSLSGAYMGGASLTKADLSYADLNDALLLYALLRGAMLEKANLRDADLEFADLVFADVSGANLSGADLRYSHFRGAKNLALEAVATAKSRHEAFYDDETIKALGLPRDHNAKLEEQRTKAIRARIQHRGEDPATAQ